TRMRHADDGGDPHAGTAGGDILQVDGADPLAARFDHILGPVGDSQESVSVCRGYVAGIEPAHGIDGIPLVTKIPANHPWAAYLERARGLSVPGKLTAFLVLDPELRSEEHTSEL